MSIKHWIVATLAIIVTAYLLPGVETTLVGAIILALVLGLINIFIKPIVYILTLPINVVTLGLFSFIINTLLIMLADKITPDFYIRSFWSALWFSIILSIISMFFGRMIKEEKK